jgi:hypothetical protein
MIYTPSREFSFMCFIKNQTLAALLVVISLLLVPAASHAFDEQLALKQFQSYARDKNIVFTFSATERTGDNSLIIKNADYYDEKLDLRQKAESVKLGNITQNSDGGLQYESIEVLNYSQTSQLANETVIATIERIITNGLKFDGTSNNANAFWPTSTSKAELSNLEMSIDQNGRKGKIYVPSITMENVNQIGTRHIFAKSVSIAPSTGTLDTNNKPAQFSLGAIQLNDTEFFGIKGLDIGLVNVATFTSSLELKNSKTLDMKFEGFSIENFFSADLGFEGSKLVSDKDSTVILKPFSLSLDNQEFAGWINGKGTTINNKTDNTVATKFDINGLYLDLQKIETTGINPQTLETLKALELLNPEGNLRLSVLWNRETGLLDINNYELEVEGDATVKMSLRITGYTEEIANSVSRTANQINTEKDPQKRQALGLQLLASLAGLKVERLELALADNSLLDRVVNYQAGKLKQEPDRIKGIVGPMTGIVLAPYQVPELADQTSAALGTFMQGNKTLRIISEPESGLALTEILALISGARAGRVSTAELVERFNLRILAE